MTQQNKTPNFAFIFIITGLFSFPFSIAITNFSFILAIILCIWNKNFHIALKQIRSEYPFFFYAILAYIAITFIGHLWSSDTAWSSHFLAKQWYWLLIPCIVGTLKTTTLQNKAMFSLSLGLSLNLVLCTLQAMGILDIHAQGSATHDATGFIGHISFGFIYSIWIAFLFQWAKEKVLKYKFLAGMLISWSSVIIFLAQGRSGYIIFIAMIFIISWQHLKNTSLFQKGILLSCILIGLTTLLLYGPAQQRILNTWSGIHSVLQGDIANSDARIRIWITSLHIWQENPILGVGTGDYPDAEKELLAQKKYQHLIIHPDQHFSHPHNTYLYALSRWGIIGLPIVLILLYAWIRTGYRHIQKHPQAGHFIMMSGIALTLHGMSSTALNEYFTALFSVISLALGLALINMPSQPSTNKESRNEYSTH